MPRLILSFLLLLWAPGTFPARGALAQDVPEGTAPEEYAARRGRVRQALGEGSVPRASFLLVRSPAAARYAGDVDYPYRPDNDLLYLCGIASEQAALLLSAREVEGVGREALFLPRPGRGEGLWVARRLTPEEASRRSGIPREAVLELEKLPEVLRRALPAPRFHAPTAAPLLPRLHLGGLARSGAGETLSPGYAFLMGALGSGAFHLDLRPPAEVVAPLRQLKSPAEVRLLRKAISITCRAQVEAMRALKPGWTEGQVAAVIEYGFRMHGASGWSFPSIVGSGPNSCILHYDRYDRRIEEGDLVLMDIGAEYGFYAADVTRTVPASGRFTDRQRRVYRIVLEAQEAGIRAVKPGAALSDVHGAASAVVARGLRELGLIQEDSQVHRYFPHFTSHGLGLDVHDALLDPVLRPDMVLTVEPGIYIAEEKLGVRIEDDVLVTPEGCEVLSTSAPRSPEEIETWMRSASL